PEINSIAFEFLTGTQQRLECYTRQLIGLASSTHRPLSLVLRGRQSMLPSLRRSFDQIVFLSANAFLRTMKRRVLFDAGGRLRKRRWTPGEHDTLDSLLDANVDVERQFFERKTQIEKYVSNHLDAKSEANPVHTPNNRFEGGSIHPTI
ncbi:MAG TPA: hypothetical protein VM260_14540, partial [Pirellula sp.]|nr:hypothetical protein [Pirellula sp.]